MSALQELLDLRAIQAEKARRRLLEFTRFTMPDYLPGRHHLVLCSYLDRFVRGDIRRLMVFMPPRNGKTELVSRRLPAYLLGLNPDLSVIATSYSSDLASRNNRDVQRIIDSPGYRDLFPGTQLAGRNVRSNVTGSYLRNSDLFEVVGRRGSYRSAGVGGGITGLGFDVGVIDDPIKNREEADSPTVREAVWEWYTSTFYTRRSTSAGILLTMTRWNEDDLAGRLLKLAAEDPKADQWTIIRFPAICVDPPGPDDWRKPGEALWPERFPLAELERTRAASLYDWHALYQQDPKPEGGTEWPDSHFGPGIWFTEWPKDLTIKTIAVDPSQGKDAKWGDYSAIVKLGRSSNGILWCEAELIRCNAEQLVDRILETQAHFGAEAVAIETNLFQELLAVNLIRAARLQGMPCPVVTLINTVNKLVRIRRLGPYLAQGAIRFRGGHPGTRLLVHQLREFPLGQHDDGPDSLEMALRCMIELWNTRRANQPQRLRP